MELNQLYYFRVVAETQNMTEAAERLHITQPSLSKVIKRLMRKLAVLLKAVRAEIYIAVLALAAAGAFLTFPAGQQKLWDVITSPVFLVLAAGAAGLTVRAVKGGLRK